MTTCTELGGEGRLGWLSLVAGDAAGELCHAAVAGHVWSCSLTFPQKDSHTIAIKISTLRRWSTGFQVIGFSELAAFGDTSFGILQLVAEQEQLSAARPTGLAPGLALTRWGHCPEHGGCKWCFLLQFSMLTVSASLNWSCNVDHWSY
eukprot:5031451-Amphidinium_carterae.1